MLSEGCITPKVKVGLVEADLARVVASKMCHHLATKINKGVARASECSDS